MFAGYVPGWTALWVILYLQLVHGQDGNCSSCFFFAEGPTFIWTWAANGPYNESGTNKVGTDVPVMNRETITLTQTIVTIINTVLDAATTTTLINYPDGQAPLTNDAGTRIETITYSRLGETHTTILTFPHPFVLWPASYTWTSYSDCASVTGGLVTIQSNPQSDYPAVSPTNIGPYNPLGSDYYLVHGYWNDELFSRYSDQFPDQFAIQGCTIFSSGGPAFGGYTITEWMGETSVSIEDVPASTTSSNDAALTTKATSIASLTVSEQNGVTTLSATTPSVSKQTSVAPSDDPTASSSSSSSDDTNQPTQSVTASDSSLSPTGTADVQSTSISATSSDAASVTAMLFIRTLFVVGPTAVAVLALL